MTVDSHFDSSLMNERNSQGCGSDPCPSPVRGSNKMRFLRYAQILGDLAYRVDRRHRTIVRNNLKFAFPDWTESRVRQVSRQTFQNLGRLITEILQASHMSRAEILSRCRLSGAEHFQRALEGGRGMLLVSAHLGNWEIALQYLAYRFRTPILLVVRPFSPAPLERWMHAVRSRCGNQVISKKKALPDMMKTIRNGGIVAIMADVSRRKASVPVNFFSHRARANHAAALLAVRRGTPVIAAFSSRMDDGRFSIDIPPPIAIQKSGNLKDLLKINTQRITDATEWAIRRQPDQYLWLQKRWKDYYPQLYPGYRPRSELPDEKFSIVKGSESSPEKFER